MIPPPPAEGPSAPGGPGAVNPAALSVAQLARMLGVPEETVRRHVAAGAPAATDGSVNLVHYAAWLNRELARDDGDGQATS
jgi:DeoR/GlpR family transcriptional regulator of sugar metabolism